MKKAELLAIIEAMPDDADIRVADTEYGGVCDIEGIVEAVDHDDWMNSSLDWAIENNIFVIEV